DLPAGVTVLLETHDSHPRGADVARILRAVDHPRVRAGWDLLHPWRHGEPVTATAAILRPWLAHVQLKDVRSLSLGARPAEPLYATVVDALLAVADALPAQVRNTDLANAAREVASVAAQEHFAALERDLLRTIFTRGALVAGDVAKVAQLRGAQEQRQAEFARIADPASVAVQSRLLDGADVSAARRMRDVALAADSTPGGLKIDGDAWYVAQSGVVRRHNLIAQDLSERLDQQAAKLARDTRQRAIVSGGTALA
ncbi:nitrate- and nitrite sensing domain-containing protein, partial [Micromonospora zhanjiangensis]